MLKFTASHEWARLQADGALAVGISAQGQSMLGDMVFVELPAIGRKVVAGEACAVVESVKAASDVHAPVGGTIIAVNAQLSDSPEDLNNTPYASWIFTLQADNLADLDGLMDEAHYLATLA
ncbi:MAG: glycine cleavage system protein GcvH [Sideroxydans sp.]|nr:glycine cleavage system protein GcvH [Sideroxydans sp.]